MYIINISDLRVSACVSPVSPCKDSKYRSFDGTCNNLASPRLGSVNSPYKRMLEAAYGPDGSPRGVTSYSSATGYVSDLPSPRAIRWTFEVIPMTTSIFSTLSISQRYLRHK